MRVQTGIYDPIQIGDKSKWYANSLQSMTYHVSPNSDMTIFQLAEHHTEAPTGITITSSACNIVLYMAVASIQFILINTAFGR